MIKVGQFTVDTGAPNYTQSVTGIGFTPKAIIFFSGNNTAESSTSDIRNSIGFVTSASDTISGAISCNNTATADCNKYYHNTTALDLVDAAGAIDGSFNFTSFDANGFTITWTNSPTASQFVSYMAFGGDTLTNVVAKEWTMTAGTGNTAYTGMGFQPDFGIFFTTESTAVGTSTTAKWSYRYC